MPGKRTHVTAPLVTTRAAHALQLGTRRTALGVLWLGSSLAALAGCLDNDERAGDPRPGPTPGVVESALDEPGLPFPEMPLPAGDIPFWLLPPEIGEPLGNAGDRLEQCFERGGTLQECAGTAALCFFRDYAIDQAGGGLGEKLGLFELFKNYYCDGECFHCCWVPGSGTGGAGGACHTSLRGTPRAPPREAGRAPGGGVNEIDGTQRRVWGQDNQRSPRGQAGAGG